jgi:hypothetical protein
VKLAWTMNYCPNSGVKHEPYLNFSVGDCWLHHYTNRYKSGWVC